METFKELSLNNKTDGEDECSNLSKMFDTGFDMYNNINKTDKPTNSPEVQRSIKKTMKLFEDSTKLVSLVNMFSGNETFEEVATENIKYFLLPALLGTLTTKLCGSEDRTHIVDVSEIYFVDFLRRLKSYEIIDMEIPEIKQDNIEEAVVTHTKSNAELITEMVNMRNTKIQRFQKQRELEKKLETLKSNLENPNIDEDCKREYFITLLKVFANQAVDELSSLAAERPILEHMKKLGHDKDLSGETKKPKIPSAKLQPIIITRDALQKKVFGAGYPSLPVLTVEEFYQQKVKDGEWPAGGPKNQIGSKSLQDMYNGKFNENLEKEKEDKEMERKIETDDPETLARARAMDEYKDTHKRGWGNRANKS